jgi:hypothetical protein
LEGAKIYFAKLFMVEGENFKLLFEVGLQETNVREK